jgi:divalent metal cation (Fe/Co/Zn/Cd) transporter
MWASLAVMAGLAASYAGQRYSIPQLEYADTIAALVVAGIILNVSWRLARETVDVLLDATPTVDAATGHTVTKDELRSNLIHDLRAIPGVISVDRLRTRQSGPNYFADVTLGMPRNLTFQRSEQLTTAATHAVQRHLPGADVVVHTVPTASVAETVHDRVRAVAAQRNLAIHEITVQQVEGGLHVEQHLELDERMPLRQAHALVTDLEAEIRRQVPSITSILTHIESEPATIEKPASLERDRELEQRLRRVAAQFPEILDIHEVFVTRSRTRGASSGVEHIQVSCHCTLSDELPMGRVHAVITALEGAFKIEAPEVDRLLIHPEPATDNRR